MIEWYKDEKLSIFFDREPMVRMRTILPDMTACEKHIRIKYPFENMRELKVVLVDTRKPVDTLYSDPLSISPCFACASQGEKIVLNYFRMPLLASPCLHKGRNIVYSFTIRKNYCYDGASIPRVFWRLIGAPTDNSFLIAALIHDILCENHNYINNDRSLSTNVFNALLKCAGVNGFKRFLMKNSVAFYQTLFCRW